LRIYVCNDILMVFPNGRGDTRKGELMVIKTSWVRKKEQFEAEIESCSFNEAVRLIEDLDRRFYCSLHDLNVLSDEIEDKTLKGFVDSLYNYCCSLSDSIGKFTVLLSKIESEFDKVSGIAHRFAVTATRVVRLSDDINDFAKDL
jgi:hypothetical protein